CGARWILPRHRQSLQKFLKRSGASSVYLTVCWMFLGPSHACSARVSCPALARAKPQACRNMCGKMVKGIPARLPRRSNSVPKLLADIGPPRSLVNTYGDASCSRCRRLRARISGPFSPQCQLPRASLFREKDGTGAPRGRLSRVNYLGSRAFRATRGSRAPTMLLCNRGRLPDRHRLLRRVFLNPLLAGQLCGRLNDIAMPLLSLDLGGGFSVDSICHLADCPGLAIQREFHSLFRNSPHFADALRIVLVNRLCEHNSQLISKLLPYQRSVLVMCTDEFFLDRVSVDRFLQGATFQTSFFTDVFLGLSYHDGCIPVFHFASSDG